jgi:hypothetical protein
VEYRGENYATGHPEAPRNHSEGPRNDSEAPKNDSVGPKNHSQVPGNDSEAPKNDPLTPFDHPEAAHTRSTASPAHSLATTGLTGSRQPHYIVMTRNLTGKNRLACGKEWTNAS